MPVAITKDMHGPGLARDTSPWKVAAVIAVMFMGSTLVTPLYVLYRRDFGFSEITLTLIYAVYAVGNLVAVLMLARLSDQIGRRAVGFLALALAGFSAAVFLSALGTAWLFAGRLLSGFAIGLASGASTAWLAELVPDQNRARATVIATTANFAGLAIGPLIAGVMAEYAPWPLRMPFVVYLGALAALVPLIGTTRETAEVRDLRRLSLQPRLGVPAEVRVAFIPPAVTAFGIFALIGFYAALMPSILIQTLHQANKAVAGAVVCELFVVSSFGIIITRTLTSRLAMLCGLALLLPSLALVVLAQLRGSLAFLLAGTVLSGVSAALGYRGSLEVVNRIAPDERRGEVVSSYYLATFLGNSLPVIGVGVLTAFAGRLAAALAFGGAIAAFALAALVTGAVTRQG